MIGFVSLADLVFGKGRRLHSSVRMEPHLLTIREKSKTLLFCVLGAGLLSCFGQSWIEGLDLIQLCLCISQCKTASSRDLWCRPCGSFD